MNNVNQQLHAIYKNVARFYDYRRLASLDEELSQDQFIKSIQKDKYMLLSAVDRALVTDDSGVLVSAKITSIKEAIESHNEKSPIDDLSITILLLIYPGTDCETKRMNMTKLINHIRFPKAEVIIITPSKVSPSVLKGLHSLKGLREHADHVFRVFTYTLLNSVLPEHELVPRYDILTTDQVSQLRGWCIDKHLLPKIFENDPQMVWIGAKVGDVIRFTCLSEVTIESIGYCIVVPNTL